MARRTTAASTSPTCGRSPTSTSTPRATRPSSTRCSTSRSTAAIRYPRTFAPHPAKEFPVRRELVLGKSETLRSGRDVALVALGHMVYVAMEAAEVLAADGIDATVVNARFVRPLDLAMIQ